MRAITTTPEFSFTNPALNIFHTNSKDVFGNLPLYAGDLEAYLERMVERPASIRTSEDVVVGRVGRHVEKLCRGYTRKQWGLAPSELDASVSARILVRMDRDDRYFSDPYQAMPLHGLTRMFENMLERPNISVGLNTDSAMFESPRATRSSSKPARRRVL
jgi:UDP-galactopyranose mutase